MTELKDVVDEVINLSDILFPKDKSECHHIAVRTIHLTEEGCILTCGNCSRLEERVCARDQCAIYCRYCLADEEIRTNFDLNDIDHYSLWEDDYDYDMETRTYTKRDKKRMW